MPHLLPNEVTQGFSEKRILDVKKAYQLVSF